jgi:hypothetical protein
MDGRNAHVYAEKTFDIAAIGERFEAIVTAARKAASRAWACPHKPAARNTGSISGTRRRTPPGVR